MKPSKFSLTSRLSSVQKFFSSNNRRSSSSQTFEFQMEQLEPRIMLAADLGEMIFQAHFEDVTVEPGQFGFYAEVSGLTATASPVEVQNNPESVGPASQGRNHLELDGVNGVFVELDGGTATDRLILKVDYSARPRISTQQSAVEVLWNGTLIQTLAADGTRIRSTDFHEFEIELPGTSGRLEFRSNSPNDVLGLGGLIDNVRVYEQKGSLTLSAIADQTIPLGQQLDITATLLPPNQNLAGAVYTLSGAPTGMQIDSQTGQITWTATQTNVDNSPSTNGETNVGDPVLQFKSSFEDVAVETGGFGFFTSTSGFSATGSQVEVQDNHPAVGAASDGSQLLELDGVNGIYRDVATVQGDQYELVFDYSPRPRLAGQQNAIEVWWNGSLLETVLADSTGLRRPNFKEYRFNLSNFTGDLTRLEFRSNSPDDHFGLGGLLDNVRLYHRPVEITEGQEGKYKVTVTVTDPDGRTDTEDFLVCVEAPPENQPPVLAPISDKTVTEGQPLAFSISATDPDVPADTLTYSLVSGPTGATLTATTGQFRWTPTETQANQSFDVTVKVEDGRDGSDTETFSIMVEALPDRPPVLTAISDQSVNENELLEVFLMATDPDTPTDQLQFALVSGPAGLTVNPTTGQLSWTPAEDQGPGDYDVTVNVTDETSLTDAKTFKITVLEVNQAPVLAPIEDQTVATGGSASLTALATDADLPANTLTYSIESGPAGATIDPQTGEFVWAPATTQTPGVYDFVIGVSDGQGGSDTEAFQVRLGVINAAPVLAAIPDQTIDELQTLSVQASATDSDLPPQTIVYSLSAAPAGATIDADSGLIGWTPDEVDGPGLHSFTVKATDTIGASDTRTFQVTVNEVNLAPVLANIPDQTVNQNSLLEFTATATDADLPPNTLTFGFSGNVPAGATIDPTTGKFAWTPSDSTTLGDYDVIVTVNDGNGGSDMQTVKISVISSTDAILLAERTNFESIYSEQVVVAENTNELVIEFADEFDKTDPDFINDAFEVALLDTDGNSLVHTFASDRDAFFNFTEDELVSTGVNTVAMGTTVRLDLSHIAVGTTANLVFRLVNNDADTDTKVRITSISTTDAMLNTPIGASFAARAAAAPVTIDFVGLTDVTGSLQVDYGQTSFDAAASTLYSNVEFTNQANHPIDGPFVLVVQSISDPNVVVIGSDGMTPEGDRYYLLDDTTGTNTIAPGATTLAQTLAFFNPGGRQFDYELAVLAQPNQAPQFVTSPNTEGEADVAYIYDSNADDPDADVLTYKLMAGPNGATIDGQTGRINWTPAMTDLGRHNVIVEVTDGRGGKDIQQYDIEIVEDRPNRPPVITSTPVVEVVLPAIPPKVIGVWNRFRAGDWNLINGNFTDDFRTDLATTFGNSTVIGSSNLNADFLSQVDVLIIGAASGYGGSDPIKPLTAVEQAALFDFVSAGGSALLYIENAFQFSAASNSLLAPFGMASSGKNQREFRTTVTDPNHPIFAGPFGTIDGYDLWWPGHLTELGQYAESLAEISSTQSVAAVIESGKINEGSGRVTVIVGQLSAGDNEFEGVPEGIFDSEEQSLYRNILTYLGGNDLLETPSPYTYDVDAVDADLDPLTYSLVNGPVGMKIDPETGLISWIPSLRNAATGESGKAMVATYTQLDISEYANQRIQDNSFWNSDEFDGGLFTVAGVPFDLPLEGNNGWGSGTDPSAEAVLEVDVNLAGVTEVHSLINSGWGENQPGVFAHIEFFGSDGAFYRFDLDGNDDIRDFNQNKFTNKINNITTINAVSFLADDDRLDKVKVVLPKEFANQTLEKIRYVDNGSNGFQRIFVSGITVAKLVPVNAANTIKIQVDDGRGGTATQEYQLRVLADPTNTAPVIVSDPVDDFFVPGFSNPASGDVSPQRISLDLGNGETFEGTVSITLPDSAARFADIVISVDESISMGGSQDWIPGMIPLLDQALKDAGIGSTAENPNRFAIVGGGRQNLVSYFFSQQPNTKYTLYGPNNEVVAEGVIDEVLPDELLNLQFEDDGRYVLVVEAENTADLADGIDIGIQGEVEDGVRVEQLQLNTLVSDHFMLPGQPVEYQFSLGADTLLYFDTQTKDLYSFITWSLDGPTGRLANNIRFLSSDTADVTPTYMAIAGDYKLTIDSTYDVASDYKFQLIDLAASTPLNSGATVADEFETKVGTKAYRFSATQGQLFSFENSTTGVHPTSKWRLIDQAGNVLISSTIGTNQGPFELPQAGEYYLLMEAALWPHEGSAQLRQPSTFEFTAEFVDPAPPTPIALGNTVDGVIDFVGDFVEYSFTLADRSNLYLDSLVNNQMTWQLTGPAGTLAAFRFDSSDSFNNANPVINLVAGDYTLRVDGNGQEGAFAFRLFDLNSAMAITPGTPFSGELTVPNETDAYRFSASAGDEFFVDVVTASDPSQANYRVYDQFGRNLLEVSSLTDGASLMIPADGEYTLLVEGWRANVGQDTYTMNLVPMLSTTQALTLGVVNNGTLTTPGESVVYTFNVATDTQLYFDSLISDPNILWSLAGPRGEEVSVLPMGRSDSYERVDATIDALAGDWRLTVQGTGDAVGDFSFALLDLLNPAHATPIAPNPGAGNPSVTITPTAGLALLQSEVFRFNAAAGDEFSFVTNVTGTIDSYYRIVDLNGVELTPRTLLSTDRLNQVLTRGGDYLLLIEPRYSNVEVDDWSIDINFVQNNGAALLSGTTLTLSATTSGDLSTASQVDEYTFEVTQRGNYYFDSLTDEDLIRWDLVGPQGTTISNRRFDLTDAHNLVDTVEDLIPGQYQIRVYASGGTPGVYQFRMHDLSTATTITPGVAFGDTIDPANGTHIYKFDVSSGDSFFFDVESASDIDSSIYKLFDPFDRHVLSGNDLRDSGPISVELDGTYSLLVEGWRANTDLDTYSMTVHRVFEGTDISLTLGALNNGSIVKPGDVVTYEFSLTDYTQIHFDSLTNNSSFTWTLTDSVGTVVSPRGFHSSDSYAVNNAILDLPPDDYRLTVDASASVTGDFAFRLLDLASATPIGFDSLVTDQLDHLGGGEAVWTTGVALAGSATNGAIDLSKPTDSLNLPAETLNGVSDFTVEFWYKTSKTGLQGLVSAANSSNANELLIELISDTEFAVSGIDSWTIDSVADGQWHHYAVTQEIGTGTTFYLDGADQGTQSGTRGTLAVDESGLFIGHEQDAVGFNLDLTQTADGQLDEMRIWDVVRTGTDISDNKDQVVAPASAGLRAYYRFDENSGDIAADQSANGFNAQYTRLTQSNSTKAYQFTALAGDIVLFESLGSDVKFSRTPYWRLVDQYGNQIFNSAFSSATSPLTLTGGTYTLLIEGDPRDVEFDGGYSFQLTSLGNANSPVAPTPITIGEVVNGSIDKRFETDRYAFTLAEDTLGYFDSLTNDNLLTWTLTNQLGTVVSARTFNSSDSSLSRLPAGDYVLSVTSNAIKPYSFAVYDLSAAPTIVPGTSQAGELTTANETDIYQFSGLQGDLIYLDVVAVDNASRANLSIVNELGIPLASGTSLVDLDTIELPADGQYFVIVEGKINQTISTTYEINVVQTNTISAALALGATQSAAIETIGQSVEYSFNLPGETTLYFDSLADTGAIQWSLEGPTAPVVTDRLFNNSDSFDSGDPLLDTLAAGDYTLTVTGVRDSVGEFSFRMVDVAGATVVSLGAPVSGELTIPSETDIYRFEGAFGDQILVDWQSVDDSDNSLYRVYDPFGNEILELRDLLDRDLPVLPFTGTYTLLVEGWRANTGLDTYEFNLRPVATRTVAINVGDVVTDSIATPGEIVAFTFDVATDSFVYFDSLTNDSQINWSLAGPTGQVVASRRIGFSDSSDFLSVFEARAGRYTLTVDGVLDTTGAFAFQLRDVATGSTVTVPTTVGNSVSVAGTLDPGNSTDAYRFDANAGDNLTFDSVSATNSSAYYRLVDPFGRSVVNQVVTGDLANVDLAVAGTYTLLIEGKNNAVVPNAYQLDLVFNGNTPSPVFGAPDYVPGTLVNATLTAGLADSYTFDLSDRSLLHMDVLNSSSDLRWSLRGPRGVEVDSLRFDRTDSIDSATSNLNLVAGRYQLDIFSNSDAAAAYGFTLHDLADALSVTPGTVFPLTPNDTIAAETDLYRFNAMAGDRFLIDVVTASDLGNTEYKIIDEYGIVVSTSSGFRDLGELIIARDGTYTLLVEGDQDNTVADTYSMNIIPIVTTTFALSPGTSNSDSITPGQELAYTFSVTDPSLFLFTPQTNSNTVNWTLTSDIGTFVSSRDFDDGILPVDLLAGNYTLIVDGVNDYAGDADFTAVIASASGQLGFDEISNTQLTQANSVAVYQFNGVAGQHFALRPDFNLVFDDAATTALTADDLSTGYDNEDQHSGIDVALRNDVFRDGAAINFITVSDEDRDVLDDNVNFETIFADLSARGALLNSIVGSGFRDENNATAIGVDNDGNAYVADGSGGFTVTAGGIAAAGNISIRQDYIDLAWALDGAAWDLGRLRAGGVTAESFTNAFVEVKVAEILEQTALRLIPSNLDADFEIIAPVGGIYSEITGGQTYDFQVRVGNNGKPISYDLLFKQGQTVGSIPVFIISPYEYGVRAVDADGDSLTWSLVVGPDGLVIDAAMGVLAWTADVVIYGEHDVTIRVEDGRGGFDEQTFVLDVNGGEAASISGRVVDLESFDLTTVNAIVEGIADPYLAGLADGATASGGDVAPDHSPTLVDGIDLIAGTTLTFTATGGVTLSGVTPSPDATPDGDPSPSGKHSNGAENGISDFVSPYNALVGVFLSDSSPDANTAPDTLDFSGAGNVVGGIDYTALAPELQQLFFIGDGVNADGTVQEITIPDGATRLYLGTTDGNGWYNNAGFFNVQITGQNYQRFSTFETIAVNPYTSVLDSPINTSDQFAIDDFEDGTFDLVGVTLSSGSVVGPGGITDSVDIDDGVIDGSGTNGRSWYFSSGLTGITISFDETELGRFPTEAGVVWTDGFGQITFRAYDGLGNLIGEQTSENADGTVVGTTADDTFFGAQSRNGISSLFISNTIGGIEIDHVQYSLNDLPSTALEWTVFLDQNRNGLLDEGETSTTTDANGEYAFNNIDAGSYAVVQQPQAGWRQIVPSFDAYEVSVDAGENLLHLDFGNVEVPLVNTDPVITSEPILSIVAGERYVYTPTIDEFDGDKLAFDLPLAPAGMGLDSQNGSIRWTPRQDQIGSQNVLLRVRDGNGGFDLQYFQIEVAEPNSAPVITSTPPTGPAGVGLPYTYDVNAVDAQEDAIAYYLSIAPAGMTIDSGTGVINWTPAADQIGVETIAVVAADERGLSSEQTFELTVELNPENVAPAFVSEPPFEVRLGDNYLYMVKTFDQNGDPTTLALAEAPAGMTLSPEGLIAWQPGPDQLGEQTVQLTVADGRGGSAIQAFVINVKTQPVNFPPTITSLPLTAAIAGESYFFQATAEDRNHDTLIWSLEAAPMGMTIVPLTGQINWEPKTTEIGTHDVTVQVIDTYGAFSQLVYKLRVRAVNTPPVIVSAPPTIGAIGSTYLYQVGATDVDQDRLTFSLESAPTGMSIEAQTGLISWTPAVGQDGPAAVKITVADSIGAKVSQTYTIEVADGQPNQLPVINSTPGFFATAGNTYTYQLTASDPDGDVLTFTLLSTTQPDMTLDATTGLLQWTPTADNLGTTIVEVVARDPAQGGSLQQFSLTVLAANNPPVVNSTPKTTLASGQPFRYDVLASDADGEFLTYELVNGPTGMVIDGVGRMFWIPGADQIGENAVEIKVTDPRGAFATQTFSLTVGADTTAPQVAIQLSDNNVDVGSMIDIRVTAIDNVNVTSLVLTLDGVAVPLDANETARVSLDTVGGITALATATDAAGNSATDTIQILVSDPNDVDGPVISITTPGDGDSITAPTNVIGSVMDDTLVSYRLLMGDFATREFKVIGNGTENVDNGVLGKIDPTLLQNGSYILRLEAFDAGGNGNVIEQVVEISGELKLGNFQLSFTDLSLPIAGIPIEITRTYDSLNANESGEFGFGWGMDFRDTDLEVNLPETGLEHVGIYSAFRSGTRVYLTLPNLGRVGFTFTPDIKILPGFGNNLVLAKPRFLADRGVNATISTGVSGYLNVNEFGELSAGGSIPYNPASPDFGGGFVVTTQDGIRYFVDGATGKLKTATDSNGNKLTFNNNGVFSESGIGVEFKRDSENRIVEITDPNGNSITYEYKSGDLSTVTDRLGNETKFVYLDDPAHYLESAIDPLGNIGVRTEYDSQGRLIGQTNETLGTGITVTQQLSDGSTKVTFADGSEEIYRYNEHGELTELIDALGRKTENAYDGSGLISQTNPLGEKTEFKRNSKGDILVQTNSDGTERFFAYDSKGRLTSQTNELGTTTVYTYDENGNLLTSTTNGVETKFTYDERGNLTGTILPDGATSEAAYDAHGFVLEQTAADGTKTEFLRDANGNELSQSVNVGTESAPKIISVKRTVDANGNVTSITDSNSKTVGQKFDAYGDLETITDQLGRELTYGYESDSRVTDVNFANGTNVSFEYDNRRRLVATTDRAGNTTRLVYDAVGNLIQRIMPDGTPEDLTDNPRFEYEFDELDRQTAVISPLGERTELTYNHLNQVTSTTTGGQTIQFAYDVIGNRISETSHTGAVTKFQYDVNGKVIKKIHPGGSSVQFTYDEVGRVASFTDEVGSVTSYLYDVVGNVTSVTDANGKETRFEYDQFGNLTKRIDAEGISVEFQNNDLGANVRTTLPDGRFATKQYREDGRLISETTFDGSTIEYEFDAKGDLIKTAPSGGDEVTYAYDSAGQLTGIGDSSGSISQEFDADGRLLLWTSPSGVTVGYEYDTNGRKTAVITQGRRIEYTYDGFSRISSVVENGDVVLTNTYDDANNVFTTEYANGVKEIVQYSDRARPTKMSIVDADDVLLDERTYVYDNANRLVSESNLDGVIQQYAYDSLGQLTGYSRSESDTLVDSIVYNYDTLGNLVLSEQNGVESTYKYSSSGELESKITAGTTVDYEYDDNGNLVSAKIGTDQLFSYVFNSLDQMISSVVTENGTTVTTTYQYDWAGLLVSKTVDGVTEDYLYDRSGSLPVLISTTQTGVTESYIHTNRIVARNDGTGHYYFYHNDPANNVRFQTNDDGEAAFEASYLPFGEIFAENALASFAADGVMFRFAGEPVDSATGLTYLRQRYYDVSLQRFVSRDPLAGDFLSPLSQQPYQYGLNSPLNYLDPSGEGVTLAELQVALSIAGTLSALSAIQVVAGMGGIGKDITYSGPLAGFGFGVAAGVGFSVDLFIGLLASDKSYTGGPNDVSGYRLGFGAGVTFGIGIGLGGAFGPTGGNADVSLRLNPVTRFLGASALTGAVIMGDVTYQLGVGNSLVAPLTLGFAHGSAAGRNIGLAAGGFANYKVGLFGAISVAVEKADADYIHGLGTSLGGGPSLGQLIDAAIAKYF